MKIVIINGSLKKEDSISAWLIRRLIPFLKGNEYGILNVSESMDHRVLRNILKAADAMIVVTPVSCGGIPSSLLALLSEMEMHALKRDIPVCTVIHGEQTDWKGLKHAENMLKIWGDRCHLNLCMHLLVAGSGQLMFRKNIPAGNQTMKKTDQALMKLVDALNGKEKGEIRISAGSPFIWKRSMEHYWKKELAANGLKKSDASVRLNENSFINK